MAHPLLEDIFNEPALWVHQKKKSNTITTLILLPPVDTLPKPPRTFDYLASNVIPIDLNDLNYRQPRPSLSTSLSRITSPRTHRSGSFSWGDHSNNKNEFKTMNGKVISTIRHIHNDAIIYNQDDFVSCILIYLGANTLIIPRDITMTTKRVNNNIDNSNTKAVSRRNSMERNKTMTTTVTKSHKLTHHINNNNKSDKKNNITTNRKRSICMEDDTHLQGRNKKEKDNPNTSSFSLLHLFDKELLNTSIRKFCDKTLIDDNIASIHNRMKEILDTTFTVLDENNNKELDHLLKDIEEEEIYEQLESYFQEETYDVVFYKITQLLLPMDLEVSRVLESMMHLDFVQVGLKAKECQRVKKAVSALRKIGSVRTPTDKLECLMTTITILSEDEVDTDSLMSLLVLTLIRSRIPQLVASLTYIKEFTFQKNLGVGQHGFTLSTLDAALQYILESRVDLSAISHRNYLFWKTLEEGNPMIPPLSLQQQEENDIKEDTKDEFKSLAQVRDCHGNNALLIAAAAGQSKSVAYLLDTLGSSTHNDMNDAGETPLMLAVKSRSVDTVQILLNKDSFTRNKAIHSKNREGDSALLLACALSNNNHQSDSTTLKQQEQQQEIINSLLSIKNQWDKNRLGQGPLHIAITTSTTETSLYLMDHIPQDEEKNINRVLEWQNNQGETFLHLCQDSKILEKYFLMISSNHPIDHSVLDIRDRQGRTPLLAWAAKNYIHMLDAYIQYIDTNKEYTRLGKRRLYVTDSNGRTCLHLLAMYNNKKLAPMSSSSSLLSFDSITSNQQDDQQQKSQQVDDDTTTIKKNQLRRIIKTLKDLVDIRDSIEGNTPFHLAVMNINNKTRYFLDFIQSLIFDAGAQFHVLNFRGARPSHVCQDPFILTLLDDIALQVKEGVDNCDYQWVVTRAITIDSNQKEVYYIIQSGSLEVGSSTVTDSRTVKRRFKDFQLLRKDLLHEFPEVFLPTLRHLFDPEKIISLIHNPYPMHILEEAVGRLNRFMEYLWEHPILRNHELVHTFVRSPELERDVILHASLARRHLLIEKICDTYPSETDLGGSDDKEYFFTFAQTTIEPLRDALLGVVRAGRRVTRSNQALEQMIQEVAQRLQTSSTITTKTRTTMAIKVCARMTCDTVYGSNSIWEELIHIFQFMYDINDGILTALQGPLYLLTQRHELRIQLEQQRERLRKAKSWNEVFSTQEQRRNIEQSKEQVVKILEKLARTGSQIIQSHQMISDEMAHFHRVHPDELNKWIRRIVKNQLKKEKLKLKWLEENLYFSTRKK
ncbi:hypothetical protein BDC45DRAFT_500209 [Circinella umbellata]|nr:hypothetical protein BDC45DRAFT_500209 [Circinella umbellata]